MGMVKMEAEEVACVVPELDAGRHADREVPEADARGEVTERSIVVDRIEESRTESFEIERVVGRPLVLRVDGRRRRRSFAAGGAAAGAGARDGAEGARVRPGRGSGEQASGETDHEHG